MSEKRKSTDSVNALLDDFFAEAFWEKSTRHRKKPRPEFRHEVLLKPGDLAAGIPIDVTFDRLNRCDRCSGRGNEPGSPEPLICPRCTGAGELRTDTDSVLGYFVQAVECAGCKGTGRQTKNPCEQCSGSGYEMRPSTIQLEIPPGTPPGTGFRLPGEGDALDRYGRRGDVIIVAMSSPPVQPGTFGKWIKRLTRR
jgi:molecular chaperone DnaJ